MRKMLLPVIVVVLVGCSTSREDAGTLFRGAASPAWSLKGAKEGLRVSVSPAGRTMRIAGTSGLVLGTAVDAMVNSRYREAIAEVLEGYDAGAVLSERAGARLGAVLPRGIELVPALESAAGFRNLRDAQAARLEQLAKAGRGCVLDLKATYGIFGYQGTLVVKLEADLMDLPGGRRVWSGEFMASSEPMLAAAKPADPMKHGGGLISTRLKADEDAIAQWTGDGGVTVRQRFEAAVDGAISAMLCDLGLVQEALGEYCLGKMASNEKRFEEADAHFLKALALGNRPVNPMDRFVVATALAPESLDALNGRAVNLGRMERTDEAIAAARALVEQAPDHGPAWLNLAWWYAVEKEDSTAAKPCYERALELGMPALDDVEKALR